MKREHLSLLSGSGFFKSKTRSGKKFRTHVKVLAKNAPKNKYGVGDTEQTRQGGYVFTYTVNSCAYCLIKGEYTTRKSLTVVFKDIVQFLPPKYIHRVQQAKQKNDEIGGVWKELTFKKGMDEIVDFVMKECDGHLLHHCIVNDINFLKNTQEWLKRIDMLDGRFFKQNTGNFHKGNITYNKYWDQITFTDTCKLLDGCYSKKSEDKFIQWSKDNNQHYLTDRNICIRRLYKWVRFVKNDTTYSQKHNSVDDVLDLLEVCNFISKTDGPIRKCEIVNVFSNQIVT